MKATISVCRVIDGVGDGDPPPDALGDPPPDALGDPLNAADSDAAGLLVLLEATHPTTVTIVTKASGGAAIKKDVRRQSGFGP